MENLPKRYFEEIWYKNYYISYKLFAYLAAGDVLPSFWKLLLLKAFRPDRLLSGAAQFVNSVFGESFLNTIELDLVKIISVLLLSFPC